MERADFVIIGRGLMGTACALHLARAGCDVILVGPDEPIDRAAHDGPFGSFHDAGRITRAISDDPVWSRLATRSIARYRDLERGAGIPFYSVRGAVMAGPETGPMAGFTQGFLACPAELGLSHERVSGVDLMQRFSCFDLPADSQAVFDPLGGVIDPRAMRRAMETLAVAAGARVIAASVTGRDRGVIALATGDRLLAGHIVVATGGWAAAAPLTTARPAMQVYQRTVLLAEIEADTAARLGQMPSLIYVPDEGQTDLYVLPPIRYPDGRIYIKIGGESTSPEAHDATTLNRWFKTTGSAQAGAVLEMELCKLMPDLAIVRSQTAACAVSFTATGYPYVAQLDALTTLVAGGNGAAAKSADEIGRLAAIASLGGNVAAEGLGTDFVPVFV